MTPNTNEAMRFLRALGSPRTLVAIEPDSGRIVAGTPDTSKAVAAWVVRLNATHGLYFTVNRTRRPLTRKPAKSDMAWADFAHMELDPAAHVQDLDAWHRELRYHIIESLWPPTHLWRSGNGIQGLWKLMPAVRIADDPEAIARVEAVNRALLDAFRGADIETQGTWNVDRLLRIPSTINWPNKAKRQAGRKPVMAGEVYHDTTAVYALEDLPTVALAIDTGAGAAVALDIGEPAPVERLSDLNIPDRLKQIIQHGRVPGQRKRPDDTRSVWEWDLICGLIRWRVPPETVLGILTDPEWQISERVLEKSDPEAAARRVIAKAHAEVTAERRADFDMLREPRPLEELLKEVFK